MPGSTDKDDEEEDTWEDINFDVLILPNMWVLRRMYSRIMSSFIKKQVLHWNDQRADIDRSNIVAKALRNIFCLLPPSDKVDNWFYYLFDQQWDAVSHDSCQDFCDACNYWLIVDAMVYGVLFMS